MHTWLVDREVEYDQPAPVPVCPENCSRCIDVCPTRALEGPFMMNYGDCIARLTYRTPSLPPLELRPKMGTWIYGCDLCQDVCPLNEGRWEENGEFPGLDEFSKVLTLKNLAEMDDDSFIRTIYPKLWYIEKDQLWLWRCNILRAMANTRNKEYVPFIQPALKHSNENVREMAPGPTKNSAQSGNKKLSASARRNLNSQAFSMVILAPSFAFLKTFGSDRTLPMILTALAARISSPRLAGVGPKKMQKALPGGQYPSSPAETTSLAPFSCLALTGMLK